MESAFCYFCLQLPAFAVGAPPPVPVEDFDRRLRTVPDAAARYVRSCGFPLLPGAVFPWGSAGSRFKAYEDQIRYEVARHRSLKAGRSEPPRPRGVAGDGALRGQIEAMGGLDPLKREHGLGEMRSRYLARMEAAHPLSREAAACYRFRLAIAWREAALGHPEGLRLFREAVDGLECRAPGSGGDRAEEERDA